MASEKIAYWMALGIFVLCLANGPARRLTGAPARLAANYVHWIDRASGRAANRVENASLVVSKREAQACQRSQVAAARAQVRWAYAQAAMARRQAAMARMQAQKVRMLNMRRVVVANPYVHLDLSLPATFTPDEN